MRVRLCLGLLRVGTVEVCSFRVLVFRFDGLLDLALVSHFHRQNPAHLGFSLDLVNKCLVKVRVLAALAEDVGASLKLLAHVADGLHHVAHVLLLDTLLVVLKTLQL